MFDIKATTLALLIPAAIVAGTATMADEGRRGGLIDFDMLDTDGDGLISAEEFAAAPQNRFDAADADGDGTLTRAEMEAAQAANAAARIDAFFERFDTDGDGAVSQDEMAAIREADADERRARMMAMLFERLDADGDGALSEAELEAARARMGERDGRGFFGGSRG